MSDFKLLLLLLHGGNGVSRLGSDCGSRLVIKMVGETTSASICFTNLLLASSSMTVTSNSDDTGVAATRLMGVSTVFLLLLFTDAAGVIVRCLLGAGLPFSYYIKITMKLEKYESGSNFGGREILIRPLLLSRGTFG